MSTFCSKASRRRACLSCLVEQGKRSQGLSPCSPAKKLAVRVKGAVGQIQQPYLLQSPLWVSRALKLGHNVRIPWHGDHNLAPAVRAHLPTIPSSTFSAPATPICLTPAHVVAWGASMPLHLLFPLSGIGLFL